MAFDAIFMSGILDEIRETCLDARVEKIHEPTRDTVILHLRCRQGRARLLIAANPAAPRLHLTEANPENPDVPPMFCMLLRKHLQGGKLLSVEQLPMERAVIFTFSCVDELGDLTEKKLVAELMGRTSNIYLLDKEGRILDCLRRVGLEAKRSALPGLRYQYPEPVEKLDPAAAAEPEIREALEAPGADLLADRLMDSFGGLSPLTCREGALYAAGDPDARLEGADCTKIANGIWRFFQTYVAGSERGAYLVRNAAGEPKAYAFCPILEYGPQMPWEKAASFGALLDSYYTLRDRRDAMRQKAQTVRKTVSNLADRTRRKLAIQEKERAATLDRERLRQLGDIVTANLHAIGRGQKVLRAVDFYDEEMREVDIPLQVQLSPQQNAAKFYKDYAKAKNAEKMLTQQMELGNTELQYLQSVLEELDRAETENELEEIRQELIQGGYLRNTGGKKRVKTALSRPMQFRSTDGFLIYVGRNNRQNDELTGKLARKDDIWLHVQKLHGCHAVIACAGAEVPDDTVTQAAELAAWFSQGAKSQNVAVDVTPVKFVKKPQGSKPGMAVYTRYRTVYVTPDPGLADRLRVK